jgi:hypothetical protein
MRTRAEELRAALGETCAVADDLSYRTNREVHPRVEELRAVYLQQRGPVGVDKEARLAWLREQMIVAERAAARAHQLLVELRDEQTALEQTL